uniref:Uncharacterized protein n=1 Tax=Engystomops pustulosus TaxID=76066 RepID=A0AAV6YHQ8_ENGPU|nr:hypothetical protein GDO81_025139 [Engystomops pustulosus]
MPAEGLTSASRLWGCRCCRQSLRSRLWPRRGSGRCRNWSGRSWKIRNHSSRSGRLIGNSSRPRCRLGSSSRPRCRLSRSRSLPTWGLHMGPRYQHGSRERQQEPPGWCLALCHRLEVRPHDGGPGHSTMQPMSSEGPPDRLCRDHNNSLEGFQGLRLFHGGEWLRTPHGVDLAAPSSGTLMKRGRKLASCQGVESKPSLPRAVAGSIFPYATGGGVRAIRAWVELDESWGLPASEGFGGLELFAAPQPREVTLQPLLHQL